MRTKQPYTRRDGPYEITYTGGGRIPRTVTIREGTRTSVLTSGEWARFRLGKSIEEAAELALIQRPA